MPWDQCCNLFCIGRGILLGIDYLKIYIYYLLFKQMFPLSFIYTMCYTRSVDLCARILLVYRPGEMDVDIYIWRNFFKTPFKVTSKRVQRL